jgi:hypothetical protein
MSAMGGKRTWLRAEWAAPFSSVCARTRQVNRHPAEVRLCPSLSRSRMATSGEGQGKPQRCPRKSRSFPGRKRESCGRTGVKRFPFTTTLRQPLRTANRPSSTVALERNSGAIALSRTRTTPVLLSASSDGSLLLLQAVRQQHKRIGRKSRCIIMPLGQGANVRNGSKADLRSLAPSPDLPSSNRLPARWDENTFPVTVVALLAPPG